MEHGFEPGRYPIVVRAGASYERSAVPPEYLSVLMVDLRQDPARCGQLVVRGRQEEHPARRSAAYTFGLTTDVDPREAKITKLKVVRANSPAVEDQTKINGGRYTAGAT